MQIAQPGMNMGQDRQMQMIGGNGGHQFRQYAGQNAGNPAGFNDVIRNQVIQNAAQNPRGSRTFRSRLHCQAKKKECCLSSDTTVDCSEGRGRNLTSSRRQASSSGTQTDSTFVYDSDGSAQVHENCDNNEIFNMFTQEEQYTELLEPIPESQQVPQNDNNVISEVTDVEQDGSLCQTVLSVALTTLSFQEVPIGKVPVLLVASSPTYLLPLL
nr:hypothetical protein [Tanacetum cinerariifolium]